jgi:hypothetical protein
LHRPARAHSAQDALVSTHSPGPGTVAPQTPHDRGHEVLMKSMLVGLVHSDSGADAHVRHSCGTESTQGTGAGVGVAVG